MPTSKIGQEVALLLVIGGLFLASPALALTDFNASNNVRNVTVHFNDSYTLNILVVPMDSVVLTDEYIDDITSIIQSLYPLEDGGVQISTLSQPLSTQNILSAAGLSGSSNAEDKRDAVFLYLETLAGAQNADKAIGVYTPEEFQSDTLLDYSSDTHGQTGLGLAKAVLVDTQFIYVPAHEIGHTIPYRLCDEADPNAWSIQNTYLASMGGCANGDANGDDVLDSTCYTGNFGAGCPTSALVNVISKSTDQYYNFMGSNVGNTYWIDNVSYNAIESRFGTVKKTSLLKRLVLIIKIGLNGNVEMKAGFVYDGGYATEQAELVPGNYTLNLTSTDGSTLYKLNFTPIFNRSSNGGSNTSNTSIITLNLPHNTTLSSVVLKEGETTKVNRSVTANAPKVENVSPGASAVITGSFNITWTSSDIDSSNLTHQIFLSEDGGQSWTVLAVDLSNTTYSTSSEHFSYGSNYVVRVFTSDGINTGSNQSSGNFTIIPSPRLTIESLLELAGNGSRKIFEAVVRNDGGYNLSSVGWSLNTGTETLTSPSNASLAIGATMSIFIEYNYTAGGEVTVNFTARNVTVSDSETLVVNASGSGGSTSASLTATFLYPAASGNVTRNEFFNATVQICCQNADCGSVNVSLDPERGEYSYFSEKHCVGNECETSFYTSPRFGYEDNQWKPIGQLRSFKGTIPITCDVQSDGQHLVKCLDYNSTHRTLRISLENGGFLRDVPVRILQPSATSGELTWTERTRTNVRLNTPLSAAQITLPVAYNEEVHVGEASTNISYLPNATGVDGWWEATGGSLALYGWLDCDANAYSAGGKSAISVNTTAASIYGEGGGSATDYTYCHRIRWNVTGTNVTRIWAYGRWTGSLSSGADSITKALYLGNVTGQSWKNLHTKTNAWGEEQHVGEVTSGISDFINDTASADYVYTLLHFNASKSGSTKAYSNLYYAELRITTDEAGGGGGNATGKGLVPVNAGTPFYTNDTNPRTITLNAGMCENVTWWVNATGNASTTHEFFAYANRTANLSVSASSARVNLTIVNQSQGSGGGNSTLVHNHTFQTTDEGWNAGTHSTAYDGYYAETTDWSTIYPDNLSLTDLNAYRIVMVVWANDSTNSKFSPSSSQTALSDPHFYYEDNGATMSLKLYNGSYHTITGSIPLDTNVTWTIDVNRTTACLNASFTWSGGSATLTEKCGVNASKDFVHWSAGDITGFDRIMDFKVYDLS